MRRESYGQAPGLVQRKERGGATDKKWDQSVITRFQVRDHVIEGQVEPVQVLGSEDSERLRGEERGSADVGKVMVKLLPYEVTSVERSKGMTGR